MDDTDAVLLDGLDVDVPSSPVAEEEEDEAASEGTTLFPFGS